MKTILVVEDLENQQGSVLDICLQWENKYIILNTYEINDAIARIPKENIDLVICDLSNANSTVVKRLERLTFARPYVPCIAIINENCSFSAEILKIGINSCIKRPIDQKELTRWIAELLEVTTSGIIHGLPLHSLLQMLEGEKKTCTLKVSTKKCLGFIYLKKGAVIAAETNGEKGEEAFNSIVTWDKSVVQIKFFNCQRKQEIDKSLISLLMEAFRLKDERSNLDENKKSEKKNKPDLKRISTADNEFFIEIGAKAKLVFNNLDISMRSSVIGLIPDEYVIVTVESSAATLASLEKTIEEKTPVTVKYLHMGKICLFKTHLLEVLKKPTKMLFFDYPKVIHYHELRKAKRTPIFIPCTFIHPDSTKYMGVIADLSHVGCLCRIKISGKDPTEMDINTKVQLLCLVPGLKKDEILHGLVKNSKKNRSEMYIGIEFYDLAEHVINAIDKYLLSVETLFN